MHSNVAASRSAFTQLLYPSVVPCRYSPLFPRLRTAYSPPCNALVRLNVLIRSRELRGNLVTDNENTWPGFKALIDVLECLIGCFGVEEVRDWHKGGRDHRSDKPKRVAKIVDSWQRILQSVSHPIQVRACGWSVRKIKVNTCTTAQLQIQSVAIANDAPFVCISSALISIG